MPSSKQPIFYPTRTDLDRLEASLDVIEVASRRLEREARIAYRDLDDESGIKRVAKHIKDFDTGINTALSILHDWSTIKRALNRSGDNEIGPNAIRERIAELEALLEAIEEAGSGGAWAGGTSTRPPPTDEGQKNKPGANRLRDQDR